MTAARVLALVAFTAIAGPVANAIVLAAREVAAEPPGDVRGARPAANVRRNGGGAGAFVRTRRWSAKSRPRVSAGVLVRAASRKPLDRAACAPVASRRDAGGSASAGEARDARATPPPDEPCPQSGEGKGEHVEIDWHADPATH